MNIAISCIRYQLMYNFRLSFVQKFPNTLAFSVERCEKDLGQKMSNF
jgi:hypothetical protein